jgi:hypothetical protein
MIQLITPLFSITNKILDLPTRLVSSVYPKLHWKYVSLYMLQLFLFAVILYISKTS